MNNILMFFTTAAIIFFIVAGGYMFHKEYIKNETVVIKEIQQIYPPECIMLLMKPHQDSSMKKGEKKYEL